MTKMTIYTSELFFASFRAKATFLRAEASRQELKHIFCIYYYALYASRPNIQVAQ